jgi:transcriptional regulator with XRE-family HTH domain
MTGEQIRAGRALARIEQSELARLCGVSLETIKRLERIRGAVDANVRTLEAILQAFDSLGIQFASCEDGGVGVCMPPPGAGQRRPRRSGQALGGAERAQPMHRLIYCSTVATPGRDAARAVLDEVMGAGAARNDANDVTGVLVAYDGRFLQVLEGSKLAVQQTYGAISTDPVHRNLHVIESRATTAARQFPDWSLCYAAFPADCQVLVRQGASSGGFRPETFSTASALDVLKTARDLQRANPLSQRTGIVNCPLVSECESRSCSFVAAPKSAPPDAASLHG